MRAWVIHEFGDPGVFQERDMPLPELKPNHVRIQVAATSVNPVDCKIRRGAPMAPNLPAILHGDVAGTVVAVGEGVTAFAVGDEVYGCAGGVKGSGGALAEYMVADAHLLARKPKSLTMAEAAALPLVAITAWEALLDRAQVQPGDKVLVYGGTGGVGHIGVQLAKAAGATVYATVGSEAKGAIARRLGADVTIPYPNQTVAEFVAAHTGGAGFDIVFDTVGNHNLPNAFAAAKLGGTVVTTAARSQQDLTPLHSKGLTLHGVYMLIPLLHGVGRAHHGEILTKLAHWVDQGSVRPWLDRAQTFRFADVAAAHHHLESGQAIGKVVLTQ